MFPAQSDPTGSKSELPVATLSISAKMKQDPEDWTEDEMRRWLNAVCLSLERNL